MTQAMPPFVTIVVPVLNEEPYIARCLASLLTQGKLWADGSAFEILVMDGGSTDRTRDIVTELCASEPALRLVDNPKRLQSCAMNLAARIASPRATVLLRADAHAAYPDNFLASCMSELSRTGAASVVVPMVTTGEAGFQRAVAAAQNSLLGNGGSAHRRASRSRFVDHGHHAAFDRAFFLKIGGYNEAWSHNEDAEYDHRVSLAGGRVWMCGDATPLYYPRRDPWGLAKQYFHHGSGRARTLLTHHIRPRLRQLMPLLILCGSLGGLLLTPVYSGFALLPLVYCLICMGWGAVAAARHGDPWLLAIGPAAMIMHLSWGAGFIWRCLGLLGQSATHVAARVTHPLTTPADSGTHVH